MAYVCDEIAKGRSLRSVCSEAGMPDPATVIKWTLEDKELAQHYARARADQADTYADQIIEIADSAEDANLAKVQIDARKWVAARLLPKKWGDRQEIEHTGKIESIVVNVQTKLPPKA